MPVFALRDLHIGGRRVDPLGGGLAFGLVSLAICRMSESVRKERSGWAVLNSPIVIALLTSGVLAALGATYSNRLAADARREARREEMVGLATELRLRVERLEAIDVALLRTREAKARVQLGAAVRDVIEGNSARAATQPRFRGVNMRALIDQASTADDYHRWPDLRRDLAILDASDRIAAAELRVQMPRLREFARTTSVRWSPGP